jgi:hypothetical protein
MKVQDSEIERHGDCPVNKEAGQKGAETEGNNSKQKPSGQR